MANVRLRSVHWVTPVADVLGGVEGAESEAIEEVAGVEETGDGADGPTRALLQNLRHVLQKVQGFEVGKVIERYTTSFSFEYEKSGRS